MKYIIKDWAGNHLFVGQTFKTFESAWDFIYDFFHENNMNPEEYGQEYEVCEVEL